MVDDPDRPDNDSNGEIRKSLSEAIDPLDSVTPDANPTDFVVLGEKTADANVVGMGEASHGTREFFQLKQRLFRYLVEKHGFRMLGLETNFAATLDINEYVVRGEGTAEDVLAQKCIHSPYRTESILRLIEWIRTFNEGRVRDDKIRFHGIDVQYPPVAATKLKTYFETTDPEVIGNIEKDLVYLINHGFPDFSDDEELRAHLEARKAVVSTSGEAIDEHEKAYVDATSWEEYEKAGRLVWMIEQGRKQFEAILEDRTDTGANIQIRDSAMAAQVQWLLRHEPADRIALWGHNAHLARGAFSGGTVRHEQGIPSLGRNLAALENIDYYALGLILGGGTVSAVHIPEQEFRAYEIEEPPEGSVPDVFSRIETPLFFLDLANLPANSILGEWLNTGPLQYDITGGYENTPVNLTESNFQTQFDGLIFIRETTASRPLSTEN